MGDAKSITDVILAELTKVGPTSSKIISQIYNGASVMVGLCGKVQRLLQERENRMIPCVHCLNHQLHLVVVHAMSVKQAISNFFPQRMAEPTPFLPPFFPLPEISSFWETSIAITPSGTQEVLPTPKGEEVFDWVISSDLLPLNDPDTPTLLHRSSGSCSSSEISFAPFSLAFSCSWEVL